jgi:uncharacterized membrane protein YkvA (DUF1232 family)
MGRNDRYRKTTSTPADEADVEARDVPRRGDSNGADDYSESSFWAKVRGFAKVAGREVIGKALILYYTARADETPGWAKTVIYSSLAYFITPLDAIPDVVPVVGFSDDLGALAACISMTAAFVTPAIRKLARDKLSKWFG